MPGHFRIAYCFDDRTLEGSLDGFWAAIEALPIGLGMTPSQASRPFSPDPVIGTRYTLCVLNRAPFDQLVQPG